LSAHPARNGSHNGTSNRDRCANRLNLKILEQRSALSNPMGARSDEGGKPNKLDLKAVKKDPLRS